ncbi:hypothetical protein MBLNU459_g4555t3 [Dothideomycetes sp. NU459]
MKCLRKRSFSSSSTLSARPVVRQVDSYVSYFPGVYRSSELRRRGREGLTGREFAAHLDDHAANASGISIQSYARTQSHSSALCLRGNKLSTSVEQYQVVLNRLFPNKDVESLMSLPREELINLALTLPAATASPPSLEPPSNPPDTTPRSDGAESLEALEQAPDQDPVLDEAKRHRDKVQGISDDVNGLSLSVDKPSSYVGASSITAALKVIFKTAPAARRFVAHSHTETALPSRANTPPPLHASNLNPTYLPSAEIGHALIESYFSRIHALMPMIDEHQFWHTWLYGERKDAPWLALLNTVFALGSLASSTSDSDQHIAYFQRARQHLELESLGSGNLLVLQALALLSGY